MPLDSKAPLELYEARNAVRIARWTGAEQYAPDTYLKAVQGLENAEGYLTGKAGNKPIGTVAREAVQMAEDARIITIKKMGEEALAGERRAGAEREALAESKRARPRKTQPALRGMRKRRGLPHRRTRTALKQAELDAQLEAAVRCKRIA